MAQIKKVLRRSNALAAAGVFLLATIISVIPYERVSAGLITSRSLMVSSTQASDDVLDGADENVSTIPGHPNNGTMVDHMYSFKPYSVTDLQSFTIEYCDEAFGYLGAGACATDPNGFDASAWNAGTAVVRVNNLNPLNYTVTATGTNYLTLTGVTAVDITAVTDVVTIDFTATANDHFQNPDSSYIGGGAGQHPTGTYFAHISSYSDNAAAVLVDEGTVTNNITESISIYTRVQETLNFSVEGDDANDGATPANATCDPLTASGLIRMGDSNYALDYGMAYFAKSYFRLATNSSYGATVYYSGETLTSGGDSITAIGPAQTASAPNNEQFGMAFDTTDADGDIWESQVTALTPVAAYDNNTLGYAFDDSSFNAPVVLAASSDVVRCETGALEYVANITEDTEAGIYTTKINYISAPSY
jgi:hypothetical protein